MVKIDRASEQAAKNIFEKLLPNLEIRLKVAAFLGTAIGFADVLNSSQWNLNLDANSQFIRFNVGQFFCIQVRSQEVLILCDRPTLKLMMAENERIIAEKELKIIFHGYEGKKPKNSENIDNVLSCLAKIETSIGCILKDTKIKYIDLFTQANFDFIKLAIKMPITKKMRKAHSTGAIAYLSSLLGKSINNPIYPKTDLPILVDILEQEKSKHTAMIFDPNFNFYTDARGGDPDSTSPTLRAYHKLLWSKPLPNGQIFTLKTNTAGVYLHHNSALGEFFLGSDAITHSYKNQSRKQSIVSQIPTEVQGLFDKGSTIGAYCIYPKNKIDGKQTINQIRGTNAFIDDRFDLTLACIQRFYKGEESPIYDTLLRYKSFFDLFGDFKGYVEFFFLQDLLDANEEVKFYFPFDGFKTKPIIANVAAYLEYKGRAEAFVEARTARMVAYIRSLNLPILPSKV